MLRQMLLALAIMFEPPSTEEDGKQNCRIKEKTACHADSNGQTGVLWSIFNSLTRRTIKAGRYPRLPYLK